MTQIYDTIVDNCCKEIQRYGMTYRLQNVSRIGDQRVYSYESSSRQKLVVVPTFRMQWQEVYDILKAATKGKSLAVYTRLIRSKIDKDAEIQDISSDDGSGEVTGIIARYKDIEIEIEYNGSGVILRRSFTIKDHNLFGNEIYVDFPEDEE